MALFDVLGEPAQERCMVPPVFRFAPSPNGQLHLGHAYSALMNASMAEKAGGRFLVRIEDIDTVRCTRTLSRQALEDLTWLGLRWEQPVRYQSEHMAEYRVAQDRLEGMGVLYPCFCSRRDVAGRCRSLASDPEGQPLYDGHCHRLSPDAVSKHLAAGTPHAMRLDMSAACRLAGEGADARKWGDVILVRRDIGTSYHVAVVVDDALQGITDVVRGRDLEHATPIHVLLQRLLDLPSPRYFHHDLITDDGGHKLSKSAGSKSLRALRGEGATPAQVRRLVGFD